MGKCPNSASAATPPPRTPHAPEKPAVTLGLAGVVTGSGLSTSTCTGGTAAAAGKLRHKPDRCNVPQAYMPINSEDSEDGARAVLVMQYCIHAPCTALSRPVPPLYRPVPASLSSLLAPMSLLLELPWSR